MSGIEHEHVNAGLDEGFCSACHVAVDAYGGRKTEGSLRIHVRGVDSATHGSLVRNCADDVTAAHDERKGVVRCGECLVGFLTVGDRLGLEREPPALRKLPQGAVTVDRCEQLSGNHPEVFVTLGHDERKPTGRWQTGERLANGRVGTRAIRAVPERRLRFDPADRTQQVCRPHVLWQHANTAASRDRGRETRASHRIHV